MKKLFFIAMSFLFLISCGNEESTLMQEQGLTNNDVVLKDNTLHNIKTRIANAALKFREKEDSFVGTNPRLGFVMNIEQEQVTFFLSTSKEEAFSLSFDSIGRENGKQTRPQYLKTGLGKCLNPSRVDTDLKCVKRMEIQRENLTEWFDNKKDVIEHGFDIATKPEGSGKLILTINLEGATATNKNDYVLIKQNNKTIAKYSKLIVKDSKGKTVKGSLKATINKIQLVFDDSSLAYPIEIDPTISSTENKKLIASDGAENDYFGRSVAISGNFAIVGAYANDDNGSDSGSAYIFSKDEGGANNWGQVKKLTASDGTADDEFGNSVAISGNIAIVGAYHNDDNGSDSGSAYIFSKDEGGENNWGQVKKLTASDGAEDDNFGTSVAISGDFAIVGADRNSDNGLYSGSAYIFSKDEGGENNWGQVKKLIASDATEYDYFGTPVAISGDLAFVGAHGVGTYIFSKNEGGANNWGQVKKISRSGPLAISGNIAIFGASNDYSNGPRSGSAYIFSKDEGGENNWGEVKKIIPSDGARDDYFGGSVAISGNIVIVAATGDDDNALNSGSAYIFSKDEGGTNNWGEVKKLAASDAAGADFFGTSVAISGKIAIVGAYANDDNGSSSGSAYIFVVKDSQTITFDSISDKTYGDTNFSLTATASSGLDVSYTSSNPSVATISGSTVTIVGAGTTTITASQAGDENYQPATDVQQTLTVNKATLTATADNKTRNFGEANPTFTISYSGFVNSEDESVINTKPTATTTADETSSAGEYDITVSGGSDNNYDFTYQKGTLTISKASQTITFDSIPAKTYGDTSFSLTATASSGLDVSYTSSDPSVATISGSTITIVGAGTTTITASQTGNENYLAATDVQQTLTVNKATPTITTWPTASAITYGQTLADSTLSGGVSTPEGTFAFVDSTIKPDAGTANQSVIFTPNDSANYKTETGTVEVTVNKATLTATVDNKTRNFGEANPTFTISYSGFVNGEDKSVIDTEPTATTTADETSSAGEYDIIVSGGSDNNYDFTYQKGTLTIKETAPEINTISATAITTTTATLSGELKSNGGTTVTEQGICYSKTPNPTTTSGTCQTYAGTDNPFTINISGLDSNTQYNFRAFATNSVSTVYGTNLTFTTLKPLAILPSQTFAIDENSPALTTVGTVAYQGDVQGTISFAIVSGNTDSAFVINNTTGKIQVAKQNLMDYETTQEFTLEIKISDDENNDTQSVKITLNNLNDNAPEVQSSEFSISEFASNDTVVGTVQATDKDGTLNPITFDITAGNNDGIFAINTNTGDITVVDNSTLDFEKTPQYILTVEASDGTHTGNGQITINVTNQTGACQEPEKITTLPYTHQGNTENYNNNIESYGEYCGEDSQTTYTYDKNEFVYSIDLLEDEEISITIENKDNFEGRVLLLNECESNKNCIDSNSQTMTYKALSDETIFIIVEQTSETTGEYTLKVEKVETTTDEDAISDVDSVSDEDSVNDEIISDEDAISDIDSVSDEDSVNDEIIFDEDTISDIDSVSDEDSGESTKSSSGCSCSVI